MGRGDLKDQIATLQKQLDTCKANVASAKADLATCKTDSTAKDAEIATLNARIAELEAQLPPPAPAPTPYAYAGAYGRDASASGLDVMESVGLSIVPGGGTKADLDNLLAHGMKGIVWLGSYDRVNPFDFERNDDWVTKTINGIKGHPAIGLYQLTDEINGATDLVKAAVDLKARNALVKSLDPTVPTYVTMKTGAPWAPFADAADLHGLVCYPVSVQKGYNEAKIPSVIAQAKSEGIEDYITIMQDFGNSYYRLPTAAEMQHQFDQWRGTVGLKGYVIYHWKLADIDSLPDHQAVIAAENA